MRNTPEIWITRLREHLQKDILDFWLKNGIDESCGGFVSCLSRDGNWTNTDKYSIMQVRLIYAMAKGYRLFGDQRYHDAARQGMDFFLSHFWDEAFGGWFFQLDRKGTVIWEPKKQAYAFIFVVYCFAEYFGVTGDERALTAIEKSMDLLDGILHDEKNNGWYEEFSRDWSERIRVGKTFNNCMHTLEAMLACYHHLDKARFQPRIESTIDVILAQCLKSPERLPIEYFDDEWNYTIRNGQPVINYGHIMETAFFFLHVHELFDRPDLKELALHFIDFAMKYGWNEKTGMACFGTPTGGHDLLYFYWNQTESMAALARAFRMTGNEHYYTWLDQTLSIVMDRFADPKYGEWYLRVNPDGEPGVLEKGASHKACYHEVQAIAAVIQELEMAG